MKRYLLSVVLLTLSYNTNAVPTVEGNTLTFPGYYFVYEADTTDWGTYACTIFSDGPSCMLPDGDYLWGDGEDTGRVTLPAEPPSTGNTVTISESIHCSGANHNLDSSGITGGFFRPPENNTLPVASCELSCPAGEHIISIICEGRASSEVFDYTDFGENQFSVPTGIYGIDSSSAECKIYGRHPFLLDDVFPPRYNTWVEVNASAQCMAIN